MKECFEKPKDRRFPRGYGTPWITPMVGRTSLVYQLEEINELLDQYHDGNNYNEFSLKKFSGGEWTGAIYSNHW